MHVKLRNKTKLFALFRSLPPLNRKIILLTIRITNLEEIHQEINIDEKTN